ncbi:MAG: NADPH-dependent FMN reductase [Candidatus Woesearchaeota archaeon]
METKKFNIKIIIGSVREGRFAKTAGDWAKNQLENKDLDVEIIDLKDYEMPFFNEAQSPMYKQEPYKNETVAKFTKKIAQADAYLVVTPEYNHSTSGVLKNAFDWVGEEWYRKPIAFISYGSNGGARAIEHLRLIAIELQMAPIREAIHINGEQYFPALFGQTSMEEVLKSKEEAFESMTNQLLWWTKALKVAREN